MAWTESDMGLALIAALVAAILFSARSGIAAAAAAAAFALVLYVVAGDKASFMPSLAVPAGGAATPNPAAGVGPGTPAFLDPADLDRLADGSGLLHVGSEAGEMPYPGAIDGDDAATPGYLPINGPYDEAHAMGAVDWTERGREAAPRGNPFSTNRVMPPQAAGPCADDDAIAMYDGDEAATYQARSRNDPTRSLVGALRTKAVMNRYVKEELDERENTQWWGSHEY